MKALHEGALATLFIVRKTPQDPHTAPQLACHPLNNERSGFLLGWPWEAQSSPGVARESWGFCSSRQTHSRSHRGGCAGRAVALGFPRGRSLPWAEQKPSENKHPPKASSIRGDLTLSQRVIEPQPVWTHWGPRSHVQKHGGAQRSLPLREA